MTEKLFFKSDYMEGCHPRVLQRLVETNLEHTVGYGEDEYCVAAKAAIRAVCACPDAQVEFLVGGTQTNATVIDAFLQVYQGVVTAETGHICDHEAGAIEQSGHKVLTLPATDGKLTADRVEKLVCSCLANGDRQAIVMPGLVYISQPTEYGTLYSLQELTDLSRVCKQYGLTLYADGARLAYALACPENDVSLPDLSRLTDAFYIGGTKCGALFGEALVVPDGSRLKYFPTTMKQHGALLAKGRLLGVQFSELFAGGLYENLGKTAVSHAENLRTALTEVGFPLVGSSHTNQVFCIMENNKLQKLEQTVELTRWEQADDTHTVVRFVTGWATTQADTEALCALLKTL